MAMVIFCSSENGKMVIIEFPTKCNGKSARCWNGAIRATILVGPPHDAFHNADNGQSGGLLSLVSFQCGKFGMFVFANKS